LFRWVTNDHNVIDNDHGLAADGVGCSHALKTGLGQRWYAAREGVVFAFL